ncbi:MAG TPA: rhodanese-like domain-containing protein [Elainellaceae cyanobacterium]
MSIQSENILTVQKTYDFIQTYQGDRPLVVLDVRTAQEYVSGHLDKSINIDFRGEGFKEELDKLDRQSTYLVYCRSGRRSHESMQIMNEIGFYHVYDMAGGINSWQAQ